MFEIVTLTANLGSRFETFFFQFDSLDSMVACVNMVPRQLKVEEGVEHGNPFSTS